MSEAIQVICGWCEGAVGSSGQCERACDERTILDTMTPDEIVDMIRRDAAAEDIQ
jgi:hypothetical protein